MRITGASVAYERAGEKLSMVLCDLRVRRAEGKEPFRRVSAEIQNLEQILGPDARRRSHHCGVCPGCPMATWAPALWPEERARALH